MADFKSAIGRGAIVTVMNANIYTPSSETVKAWNTKSPSEIISELETAPSKAIAEIDHLKFANLTMSGPDITITGGRYANTLVKFGKSLRCEMQSALCDKDALVALGGAVYDGDSLTITDKFPGPVSIVGDTFIVDQASGEQIPVQIVIYQFLPDAIISLTQDEATAATFDLNGDVMTVSIAGDGGSCSSNISAFYSIVDNCDVA